MKASEHIINELISIEAQHLLDNIDTMPFAVPKDYFQALYQDIIANRDNIDADPEFEWRKSNPFQTPAPHYFDQLSQQIIAKIEDIGPDWGKEMPYSIPQQYFASLPDKLLQKATAQNSGPSKTLRIPIFRNVHLAASIALIIFVGFGVLQFNKEVSIKHLSLSHISQDEIQQYVNDNIDDFDTDIIVNSMSATQLAPDINNVKLNREDIQAYLEENGQ